MFNRGITRFSRGRPRAFAVAAGFSGLTAAAMVLGQPAATFERIGQGDTRIHYDSTGYKSDSKSLALLTGEAADLMGLFDSPPLGLPPMADTQNITAPIVALGRRLFFDRRLSFNGTLSCAMCHIPEQGFTQHELSTRLFELALIFELNFLALFITNYSCLQLFTLHRTDAICDMAFFAFDF